MLTIIEQSSTPAAPTAGKARLYPKADGLWYYMADDGVEMLFGVPPGYIHGLEMANNGTDPTNDIDIATGIAAADDGLGGIKLTSAITKRLDAAWAVGTNQGGLDTGSIANGTYHVWLIRRSDTGVVDALFSASATSPTMPANYDQKRRIGSIMRESAAIVGFVQNGDRFLRKVATEDLNSTNPGTSAVVVTCKVPTGIVVDAIVTGLIAESAPAASTYGLITALSQTDSVPGGALYNLIFDTSFTVSTGQFEIPTNTSAQIRLRVSRSDADVIVKVNTHGWIDRRGGSMAQASSPAFLPGQIVQCVYAQTSARVTSNVAIPFDNTIPQSGEGTEVLTATITPTNGANKLRVRFMASATNNTGAAATAAVAVFRDSGANAVAAQPGDSIPASYAGTLMVEAYVLAGSTAPTTFKIRFGPSGVSGSGFAVNGGASANYFGGVDVATLTVEEIQG